MGSGSIEIKFKHTQHHKITLLPALLFINQYTLMKTLFLFLMPMMLFSQHTDISIIQSMINNTPEDTKSFFKYLGVKPNSTNDKNYLYIDSESEYELSVFKSGKTASYLCPYSDHYFALIKSYMDDNFIFRNHIKSSEDDYYYRYFDGVHLWSLCSMVRGENKQKCIVIICVE